MPDNLAVSFLDPQLPSSDAARSPWQRLGWVGFLIVVLGALYVVLGAPIGLIFLLAALVATLFIWRFPYAGFFAFLATALLINWQISIGTSNLDVGERAFGGAIEVGVGELIALAVLGAWVLRLFFFARKNRKEDWKPWLPLAVGFIALVGAQLLSSFSVAEPDPVLVIKYALRPVFLAYLTCVLLPVNFLQTKKRLMMALAVLVCVGVFFALDGFRSLFSMIAGASLHFAQPMPIFGAYPIGDNHNALGEILIFCAPVALALSALAESVRTKRLLAYAASFMAGIALLTLSRSAWLALGVEGLFLCATVWRPWFKKHLQTFWLLLLASVPFVAVMLIYSTQAEVKGSNQSRSLLADIAWNLFKSSPWIGVGAGTFVDQVARVYAFTVEFGSPLDAHGILQKVAAETGLIGLFAFAWVIWLVVAYGREAWEWMGDHTHEERSAFMYLASAAIGSGVFQLFSTTSWTARLWLPVGIFLAAARLFYARLSADPKYLTNIHV